MDRESKDEDSSRKRRVRRYSPGRLLRQPVVAVGGEVVSAEEHKGRLVIRFDPAGKVPRATE